MANKTPTGSKPLSNRLNNITTDINKFLKIIDAQTAAIEKKAYEFAELKNTIKIQKAKIAELQEELNPVLSGYELALKIDLNEIYSRVLSGKLPKEYMDTTLNIILAR